VARALLDGRRRVGGMLLPPAEKGEGWGGGLPSTHARAKAGPSAARSWPRAADDSEAPVPYFGHSGWTESAKPHHARGESKWTAMIGFWGRSACRLRPVFLALALGIVATPSAAQPAPTQAPQTHPTQAPLAHGATPAAPARRPGLLEAIGRWVDESVAGVGRGFNAALGGLGEGAGATTQGAVDALAKGAADTASAVGRLSRPRLVAGRERCATAPNGAPDCRIAAEALCRAQGFASGRSVDYETAEKCPAHVRLSGRRPAPGECPLEHTVTRALCQ